MKKTSGQSISNMLKWKTLQRDNEAVLSQPFLTQDEEKRSAVEKKAKLREEHKMSRLLQRTGTKSVSSEVVQRLKHSL